MSRLNSAFKWVAAIRRRMGAYQARSLSQHPELHARIDRLTSAREKFTALPDLASARVVRLSENGSSNWIILAGKQRAIIAKVILMSGAADNIIVLGQDSDQPREIRFEGSGNLVLCGNAIRWADVRIRFVSNEAVVCLGHGSIYNGTAIIAEGDRCGVEIGRDCLFAPGTTIRTSDLHGIYDTQTGEWLNPPRPVVIEPHTWFGQDALALKGTVIGGGSVVAARAVVNCDLPRFSVSAGSPAKPVRHETCWSLERSAQPAQLEAVRELLRQHAAIDDTKGNP